MPMSKINYNISLPVGFLKEGNRYVAFSPVLDLSTSGKTFEEADHRFQEAVHLFIEECVAAGTLDEVLKNLGWTTVKNEWRPPLFISQESRSISL